MTLLIFNSQQERIVYRIDALIERFKALIDQRAREVCLALLFNVHSIKSILDRYGLLMDEISKENASLRAELEELNQTEELPIHQQTDTLADRDA
jgi:hypothetical protein